MLKLITYVLALESVRVADPRQLDDIVYDPVRVSALGVAPTVHSVMLTVTSPIPSNCSSPVPPSAPVTAFAPRVNPVPVKLYTPEKVLAAHPVG